MAKKQYKNVYTILEKVKKGEIKSHYKEEGGLFSRLNFYKKPDLIKPHMHWLDENRMDSIMDAYMGDDKNLKEVYEKFSKSAAFRDKIPDGKKPDIHSFKKNLMENYKKFPKHIVKDIFKMYYNKIEKLEFESRTEKNHGKFKFLEKANNPIAKIMTESSNLKSAIFARNIVGHYISKLSIMDYVDVDNSQKIKDHLSGNGDEFNEKDINDALDNMLDSADGKRGLEKAMENAKDLCKQLDDAMDDEIQERMFENATEPGKDSTAGQLSPDYIKQVAQKLSQITLSMSSLKDKIKKLLDKSVSYFSAKQETTYEDFLNSDNIAGLEEYEFLHPKLRKIFIEDIYVKETKNIGKIDLYIDISGSMGGSCGINDAEGNPVTRINFCKAFAAKLIQMDMLNNIYLFNNRVRAYKKDLISISMLDCGGGTDTNKAVQSIEQNGVNALIITDGEDSCYTYSDKTFFIGLKGSRFSGFMLDVLQQYVNKDQMVIFDGSSIKKVNKYGNAIM